MVLAPPVAYGHILQDSGSKQVASESIATNGHLPETHIAESGTPHNASTNGHVPGPTASAPNSNEHSTPNDATSKETTTPSPQSKRPQKPKRPNYAHIHAHPLPLTTHPLPTFYPSNPLSLLHILTTYLSHFLFPPSSHPPRLYPAYFSLESRSVHVTDPVTVRKLWEMGFFGKGNLSRSEPSWLEREKAKLGKEGGGGAEEATRKRREERRLFKLERARGEREKVERQRAVEEGRVEEVEGRLGEGGAVQGESGEMVQPHATGRLQEPHERPALASPDQTVLTRADDSRQPNQVPVDDKDEFEEAELLPDIRNQEHLQLTLPEAFFLAYALGVLSITSRSNSSTEPTTDTYDNTTLLRLFAHSATFPTPDLVSLAPSITSIPPDAPFLLDYVVYHHFRSLGWVVRPGMKFGVDYLLYNRGPVFSHAEFAVLIMPSYTDHYWSSAQGMKERRVKESKDWWWLHCVNRVQSQVRKTLVLCYVDVPPPLVDAQKGEEDIGQLLRKYKVREFVVRRWLANRSRD